MDEELPQDWTVHYDDGTQNYYYAHISGITQWEKPIEKPIKIKPEIIKNKSVRKKGKIVPELDFVNGDQPFDTDADDPIQEENVGGKTIDYLHIAETYKFQRKYMEPGVLIRCVLCKVNPCEDVLFPCQHRCICRNCMAYEKVKEFGSHGPSDFINCPLCGEIIKKILPHENGEEEEKYWKWVLEVNPKLPSNFLRDFRHSAAIIQKVHIDENKRARLIKEKKNAKSSCCTIL